MRVFPAVLAIVSGFAVGYPADVFSAREMSPQAGQGRLLHINQIQVIGTHNSYHAGFAPSERAFLEKMSSRTLSALDYSHAVLGEQLSGGVRQVEIDVFADTKGGRFAHLNLDDKVAAAGLPADPPFDPEHEMEKPGFKVMHVQGLDQRSTCQTFVACLTAVKTWSRSNPRHLPIFILVETKEGEVKGLPDAPKTEHFTPAVLDALDAEIRTVFEREEMITPDDVRGKYLSLNAAVKAGGWPTVESARGKVMFLMDQRSVGPVYREGHAGLKGRLIFTNAIPGEEDAAFTEENDGSREVIDGLVREGYLVRTRSDEPTEQARANDTRRRDLALSTGAQMISTDYPKSEPARWSGYSVGFADGLVARCNPVNKPVGCVDSLLEGR